MISSYSIKRRSFLKAAGIAGAAALLCGCGMSGAAGEDSASGNAAASGKVTTGGSTSMEKLMSALREGFAEQYPSMDVTYNPTGSSAGITGAAEGALDIGLSSRKLKPAENGVYAKTVALDGIAVIVNPGNALTELTIDQLADIFTGKITDWKEVGASSGEIVLIGREAGSGTRDGFEGICGVTDSCVYTQELTATGAVVSAVAGNSLAIGYASLASLKDNVKAIGVEGVICSEENVLNGSYAIQRPFNFITKNDSVPSPAAKLFMEFAMNTDAADYIRAAGAVPMNGT